MNEPNSENTPRIVKVPIKSMLEIPLAYQKAIDEFRHGEQEEDGFYHDDDVWDGKIELKHIEYEKNFRRSNYVCVFEITLGDFLYAK